MTPYEQALKHYRNLKTCLSLSLVEIEYTMLYVRDMRKDLDTGYIPETRI